MKRANSVFSSERRTDLSNNSDTNSKRDVSISKIEPTVREKTERVSWTDLQGKSKTQLIAETFEVPLVPMDILKLVSSFISSQYLKNWMTTCKASYWSADQYFELRRAPTLQRQASQCLNAVGQLSLEQLLFDIVKKNGFYNTALLTPISGRTKALLCMHALCTSLHKFMIEGPPGAYGAKDRMERAYFSYINKLFPSEISTAICDFLNSDAGTAIHLEPFAETFFSSLESRLKQMPAKEMGMIRNAFARAIANEQ